jgi:tetracycline resistance efflux pump
MRDTFWSLLPFVMVIPIAVLTRQVLPALMIGLLTGTYMLHPTALGGIQSTLSYIVKELAVPDNLRLLVFLYGFGAFVGLVRVTGGVSGFSEWISARIHSIRGAFLLTWISSIATFMAPDFRIITVAPVMKNVFSKLNVPGRKVAFVIDATSTPLCALIPIGTAFVGYMVGLIGTAGRHQGLHAAPYGLFLASIPFNFFSFAMIGYALVMTFYRKRYPVAESQNATHHQEETAHDLRRKLPPRLALQLAHMETGAELTPTLSGRGQPVKKPTTPAYPDPVEIISKDVKPRALNLLLPLAMLLMLTLYLTWWDGHTKSPTLFGALAQANASKAMLEALLITLVASFIWYLIDRQPLHRTIFGFLNGGNEMMGVNVLLILVWAVSSVSTDLGFATYVEHVIGGIVPAMWIAPALFVFGCAISYVIGSSFGTWGMLLPLGFSLATTTHASLALIAGAVFASGTFGGFVSPLSDNTVAMATVMKLPVMSYSRMKLKAGLWMAGLCTAGYAVLGFVMR